MDRAYSIKDTARFLGVSMRTIRKWISEGKVHAHQIEGTKRWLVTATEIRRLRGEKRNADEDRFYSSGIENS